MLYQLALVLIFSSASIEADIIMKSRLTTDQEQVLIEVQLSSNENVGFELKELEGRVIFRWNDQYLNVGTHSLRLNLPKETKGKYLLSLIAESNNIDHILFINN